MNKFGSEMQQMEKCPRLEEQQPKKTQRKRHPWLILMFPIFFLLWGGCHCRILSRTRGRRWTMFPPHAGTHLPGLQLTAWERSHWSTGKQYIVHIIDKWIREDKTRTYVLHNNTHVFIHTYICIYIYIYIYIYIHTYIYIYVYISTYIYRHIHVSGHCFSTVCMECWRCSPCAAWGYC